MINHGGVAVCSLDILTSRATVELRTRERNQHPEKFTEVCHRNRTETVFRVEHGGRAQYLGDKSGEIESVRRVVHGLLSQPGVGGGIELFRQIVQLGVQPVCAREFPPTPRRVDPQLTGDCRVKIVTFSTMSRTGLDGRGNELVGDKTLSPDRGPESVSRRVGGRYSDCRRHCRTRAFAALGRA